MRALVRNESATNQPLENKQKSNQQPTNMKACSVVKERRSSRRRNATAKPLVVEILRQAAARAAL